MAKYFEEGVCGEIGGVVGTGRDLSLRADKMEESITESLQQAEALWQSILKKAFEGRLI